MQAALVRLTPELRALARSLCRHRALADDLVQDTLLRAWANRHRFERGTNVRAWLFTILRNLYFSDLRRSGREIGDAEGKHAATISVRAVQGDLLDVEDFRRALHLLSPEQREAIILVAASDLSYAEAAQVCGCPIGTVKSRVARARIRLLEILSGSAPLPPLEEALPTTLQLAVGLTFRYRAGSAWEARAA